MSLIANGARLLLAHPEQLGALRAEPALIEAAVEENVRYDGPGRRRSPATPARSLPSTG